MSEKSQSPPGASTSVRPRAELIGVDPDFARVDEADNDSAIGDSSTILSSTASIGSTILAYRKLHGRTFQNFHGAEYWGPNDEKQNEGLDIAHHMMYLALDNKLLLSPLENPQKVLDVGTGTGIWAIDFADEFPSAEVIGTDLSPIQPAWMPPNCKFELDDCSLDWTYPANTFDFIHIRCLLGSIKDWVKVYRECLRCLRPGGWLEHADYSVHITADDGSLPDNCVWYDWRDIFLRAGEKMGQTFEPTDHGNSVRWMTEAGFSGPIHTRSIKLPIGAWPADKKWKEIGVFNLLMAESSLEGYVLYLCTNVLSWKYEQVQVMVAKVRQAMKNRAYHAYYPLNIAYTQKALL